jgi:hypothetical protein
VIRSFTGIDWPPASPHSIVANWETNTRQVDNENRRSCPLRRNAVSPFPPGDGGHEDIDCDCR